MKINTSKLETTTIALVSIVTFLFLYLFPGGPISADEIQYLSMAIDPYPHDILVSRYFHVYFQKLFVTIFDSPIKASTTYWSFLITASSLFIYLIAKKYAGILAGALSVVFFLFNPFISHLYTGVSYTDFTLMLVLTAICYLLLFEIKTPKYEIANSFLVGTLLFLSFKSKEVSLIILPCILIYFLNSWSSPDFVECIII